MLNGIHASFYFILTIFIQHFTCHIIYCHHYLQMHECFSLSSFPDEGICKLPNRKRESAALTNHCLSGQHYRGNHLLHHSQDEVSNIGGMHNHLE